MAIRLGLLAIALGLLTVRLSLLSVTGLPICLLPVALGLAITLLAVRLTIATILGLGLLLRTHHEEDGHPSTDHNYQSDQHKHQHVGATTRLTGYLKATAIGNEGVSVNLTAARRNHPTIKGDTHLRADTRGGEGAAAAFNLDVVTIAANRDAK